MKTCFWCGRPPVEDITTAHEAPHLIWCPRFSRIEWEEEMKRRADKFAELMKQQKAPNA